jgi:hypothetical protein
MRSVERLKKTPSQFRRDEAAAAGKLRDELHELTSAAIERRDPWVVWLLEVWRPRRQRGRD